MVTASKLVWTAESNGRIIRCEASNPDLRDDIDLGRRAEDRVTGMYLDPHGKHLIVG